MRGCECALTITIGLKLQKILRYWVTASAARGWVPYRRGSPSPATGFGATTPENVFFLQILEAKSCILVYVKRQCRREKVTSHLILEALIIITWQRLQGEPSQRLRRCPNKIIGSTTVGHFPGHFAPPTYSPPDISPTRTIPPSFLHVGHASIYIKRSTATENWH